MNDQNSAKNSDQFFEYYANESATDETVQRFQRLFDMVLRMHAQRGLATSNLDVADIGCGAGTQCMLWAQAGHRVRGLDINEKLVNLGRERSVQRGLEIDFNIGSALDLPFADQSVDVCLVPELLEHVAEWQRCLDECCRIVRPGGTIYLSTSNYLCPRQQEFDLPFYSWYPAPLKRHYEKLSVTTRPELVNHAQYPAVNWFSYYGLRKEFKARGFGTTLDRFDCINTAQMGTLANAVVATARALPPARFLGHVMTPSTTVLAFRDPA